MHDQAHLPYFSCLLSDSKVKQVVEQHLERVSLHHLHCVAGLRTWCGRTRLQLLLEILMNKGLSSTGCKLVLVVNVGCLKSAIGGLL